MSEVITCGGVISVFEHVKELRKRGYHADIMAKGKNKSLESFYKIECVPYKPEAITDKEVVISVWYPQMKELKRGHRFQFVQGRDIDAYPTMEMKETVYNERQNKDFYPIAVSAYAGDWINREYALVPNGVSERFHSMDSKDVWEKRPFDWLIEGNNEPNKNIDEAILFARTNGGTIAWMGRETVKTKGITLFENPIQKDIPKIYESAKRFIKLSKSEGFSLPILEAMASGCIVYTRPMGGNDFCEYGINCFLVDGGKQDDDHAVRIEGIKTAWRYTWKDTVDKLLDVIG